MTREEFATRTRISASKALSMDMKDAHRLLTAIARKASTQDGGTMHCFVHKSRKTDELQLEQNDGCTVKL